MLEPNFGRIDLRKKNFLLHKTKKKKKVILYILKISTKFGVAPQSFCENQNSVQDQDHDFTLNFNTRSTFHT